MIGKSRLNRVLVAATILLGVGSFWGCTHKKQGSDTKETVASDASLSQGGLRVAVVNMDSLYSKYQYYIDVTEQLEQQAKRNAATLESKVTTFQRGMAAFQEKLQRGGFVSQTAAEQEQQRLLKMQQEGQVLEQRLADQFIQESKKANDQLYKEIQESLAEYNKEKKFDLILTDIGIENVLLYDAKYDITDDVIEYLNRAYEKNKGKKE